MAPLPTNPHFNPNWTNEQLRVQLDRAINSANIKWSAYASDLALGYIDAYNQVRNTLDNIKSVKKSRQEQADLFWNIVIPGIAGGLVGGIISMGSKKVLDALQGSAKSVATIASDSVRTAATDATKFETRKVDEAIRSVADTVPWKPTGSDPGQFGEALRNTLGHALVAKEDLLIHAGADYRSVMTILYNSPFVWMAPEETDMQKWPWQRLARVLEVFLWVDWANHRDTEYWLEKVLEATTHDDKDKKDLETELNDLNPILDRLRTCGIQERFLTQYMEFFMYGYYKSVGGGGGHRFLNVLWIRHLGPRYKNTLLGTLLSLFDANGHATGGALDLSFRPGSIPLM